MNNSNVYKKVAAITGHKLLTVSEILDTAFEEIKKVLISDTPVKVKGFGTFKTSRRKARVGRNMQTGEALQLPPYNAVTFKASQNLKRRVQGTPSVRNRARLRAK